MSKERELPAEELFLTRYLDGALGGKEQTVFEARLRAEAVLAARLEATRTLGAVYRESPRAWDGPAFSAAELAARARAQVAEEEVLRRSFGAVSDRPAPEPSGAGWAASARQRAAAEEKLAQAFRDAALLQPAGYDPASLAAQVQARLGRGRRGRAWRRAWRFLWSPPVRAAGTLAAAALLVFVGLSLVPRSPPAPRPAPPTAAWAAPGEGCAAEAARLASEARELETTAGVSPLDLLLRKRLGEAQESATDDEWAGLRGASIPLRDLRALQSVRHRVRRDSVVLPAAYGGE